MAGPTTEVLNDDIKEIKVDLKEFKGDLHRDLGVLRDELQRVAIRLAEMKGESKVTLAIAKWTGALLVTTLLTSGAAGIWWASGMTTELRLLGTRFDKFDSQLTKLVEQSRPAQLTPKNEGLMNPAGK